MPNANRPMRKIVKIDQEKCNGCGDCVPSCAEGAIKIINGKAKLSAENLCDGLGACLGHCPRGAITVEDRPADAFDDAAVRSHLATTPAPPAYHTHRAANSATPASPADPMAHAPHGGCPGSRVRQFAPIPAIASASAAPTDPPTLLRQWPVQLALLPTQGPIWQDADLLLAADCVAFAYPMFHVELLAGRTLAIACPKLDDVEPYIEKLAAILMNNTVRSLTVARMEVPCCSGLVRILQAAVRLAGRDDLVIREVVIGIRGDRKQRQADQ